MMRVSLSTSAFVLLIGSSTIWAFSTPSRPFAVRPISPALYAVPPKGRGRETFLRSTMVSSKAQAVAEARQCLTEIEDAVQTAREYLRYLEDVAQVVKAFVEGTEPPKIDLAGRPPLPELMDAGAAMDYLSNLTTAYSAAEEYLDYLEGVASNVRDYLSKWESSSQADREQEVKTRDILNDLEETARAAKDYLVYLKGVATAVEKFLADPSQPPPPELANLQSQSPPSAGAGQGTGSYLDNISSAALTRNGSMPSTPIARGSGRGPTSYLDSVSSSSLPSFGSGVNSGTFAKPPPAPVPSSQPPAGRGSGTSNYLDIISSATPTGTSGSGMQSFADSMSASSARPSGGGTQSSADSMSAGAPAPAAAPQTSYVDKMASAENASPKPEVKPTPSKISPPSKPSSTSVAKERNYLDAISSKSPSIKGRGSGQKGYLDSIKGSSSTIRGSGVAQKRYTDNLKTSSTRSTGKKAPSGYLGSLEQSQGTRKKPTFGASNIKRDDVGSESTGALGPGLSVFLSLVFITAGALVQWFNTSPESVDEVLRVINVVPVEKTESRPAIVDQLAPPTPPPPKVTPAPPAPATEPDDFDDWSF